MSEQTYFCFREDNCKFETLTREQIENAITNATGTSTVDADSAYITKIKESNGNNNLTFWQGTEAQFNALKITATPQKVLIDENKKIYILPGLNDIPDNSINSAKIANGAITNEKLSSDLIVPIRKGGTGAITAAAALTNLGAQSKIRVSSVSLPTASWTGSGPWSQIITIPGTTANSKIDINPDTAVLTIAINEWFSLTIENNDGTITAYAVGAKPSQDLTIQVSITEVSQ